MSQSEQDETNLSYQANAILTGIHRDSDQGSKADVKILQDEIDEVDDFYQDRVEYALEVLREYFSNRDTSNLSRRDAEIFAAYVREIFTV